MAETEQVRVGREELVRFCSRVFERLGLTEEDAASWPTYWWRRRARHPLARRGPAAALHQRAADGADAAGCAG